MVTVADASVLLEVLSSRDSLGTSALTKEELTKSEGTATGGEDRERSIADLLCDQLEFANVIVLNKEDCLNKGKKPMVESLVRKLNPKAKLVWTTFGKMDEGTVLGTKLFDLEEAQTSAGWIQELSGAAHVPETEEYGISSMVFRARRPFHPKKLFNLIQGMGTVNLMHHQRCSSDDVDKTRSPLVSVIRSKGCVWLANACAFQVLWHSAGSTLKLSPAQPFDAALQEAGENE